VAPQVRSIQKAYLGSDSEATVYSAEVCGIIMALHMAIRHSEIYQKVAIFTNNKAAIRSVHQPKCQSGQYLWDRAVYVLKGLRKRKVEVEIRWIPAHIGMEGNEKVDTGAKEATGWKIVRVGETRGEVDSPNTATKRHGYVQVATRAQILNCQLKAE
jgi:ribonuclease HI